MPAACDADTAGSFCSISDLALAVADVVRQRGIFVVSFICACLVMRDAGGVWLELNSAGSCYCYGGEEIKSAGIGVGVGVRRSDGVVWKEINKQTMRRMGYKQEQRVRTEAEIEK